MRLACQRRLFSGNLPASFSFSVVCINFVIIFIPGRLYPIELKYQPVQIEEAMYAKSHDRAKIVTSASLEERYNPESSSADSDKRSGRKQKSKHADIDVQPFIQACDSYV